MKTEADTLRKLNRYHEKLVLKLTKQLAAEKAKVKKLRASLTRQGRN